MCGGAKSDVKCCRALYLEWRSSKYIQTIVEQLFSFLYMLLKVSRTDSFEIVCRKEFFQLDKRRDILVLISCECHDFTSFILPLHTFSEVNLLWPTCLIRAHFREGRKPTDNFVYVYARKFSLSLSLHAGILCTIYRIFAPSSAFLLYWVPISPFLSGCRCNIPNGGSVVFIAHWVEMWMKGGLSTCEGM